MQILARFFAVFNEAIPLEDIDNGQPGGTGYGMALIGEAVIKVNPLTEGFVYLIAYDHASKGCIEAGYALSHYHHVGLNIEVLHGKPPACPAETGDDLIGNEENVVLIADIPDGLPIGGRGHKPVIASAADWRGHECHDIAGPVVVDALLQLLGYANSVFLGAHIRGSSMLAVLMDLWPPDYHGIERSPQSR